MYCILLALLVLPAHQILFCGTLLDSQLQV